ncbi:hypothetical protein C8R44DRAFT_889436 [Mycena epipterygia]|nr:hypothetical protein C8R44DRAFT_889436 [Mycena epipterygia]
MTLTASALLTSSPRLEDLTFDHCDLVARQGGLLRLKSFTLCRIWFGTGIAEEEPLETVASDRLCTLKIIHGADTSPLLVGLTRDKKLTQLVDLSLHAIHDVDLLLSCLSHCLQLEMKFSVRPLPTHIHPNTIPLLQNLTAPRCGPLVDAKSPPLLLALLDSSQASVRLRSLVVIPPTSPTPDPFRAITSLFPELRDSFLTTHEDDPFEWLFETINRNFLTTVDDFPPEDISDDEGEDAPQAVVTLVQDSIHPELSENTNLSNILNEICDGVVSLLPQITALCLQVEIVIPRILATEGDQVVASLTRLYPFLREIRTELLGTVIGYARARARFG